MIRDICMKGNPIPCAIELFAIRYKGIALDSNTLNITYDLFTTVLNSTSATALPQDCRNDLAVDDPVVVDALYTVHAWMAVVAYLLSDYKFLYD